MAEDSEKRPAIAVDKTGEFFNVGAPLHAVRPGYVRRPADDLLFDALVAGNYAHVIAPDRTGKTSLIASTSARLQNNGFKVAVLDLEQISERDGGSDAGRLVLQYCLPAVTPTATEDRSANLVAGSLDT